MDLNFIFSNFVAKDLLDIDIDSIKNYCYNLKKTTQGRVLSNYGGWQSQDLEDEDPELKQLTTEILSRANTLLKEFKLVDNAYIENMWVNINQKHDFNKSHEHPNSILSGVFYVSAPTNCGKIFFKNPNPLVKYYVNKKFILEHNHLTSSEWWFQPQDGMLLIFPSWLEHFVAPNNSEADRISIAFNTKIYE
jgi:uncharacterized protein (TIGR02466 family)